MRKRNKKIMILIIFISLFPTTGFAAAFLEVPPEEINFDPITLNGDLQSTNGGEGNISVKATNLLGEKWEVTVQGSELRQTDGSGLVLPKGSLQLNKPVLETEIDCDCTIGDGPWFIDNEEPVVLLDGGFYPLGLVFGWFTVRFDPYPFTLFIYPNEKMIDPGHTEATYQTTITWTLSSIGL